MLTPESPEAKAAVEEILHSACKQVFIDGLFHGDPHSGNILVDDAGTLCMIDLGMVGRLSEAQRDDLVSLILAAITGDSATIARVLLKMGTPTQRVNMKDLKAEIDRIRGQFLAVGSLENYDSAGFIEEFAAAAGKFRIKLATEYAIAIKALATIEGIIRSLHPRVDLVGIAQPYLKQIIARRFDPQHLVRELVGEAAGLGSTLRTLPSQLDQVLHDFETGNIQVRAVTPELDDIPAVVHQVGSRIVLGVFAASMTLATAIVLPDGESFAWRIGLAVLCGAAATLSWTTLFWWHFLGRGRPVRVTPLLRFFRR
jgi:ubiquinone biosynthesis protein